MSFFISTNLGKYFYFGNCGPSFLMTDVAHSAGREFMFLLTAFQPYRPDCAGSWPLASEWRPYLPGRSGLTNAALCSTGGDLFLSLAAR
jgi:hypothetical protein